MTTLAPCPSIVAALPYVSIMLNIVSRRPNNIIIEDICQQHKLHLGLVAVMLERPRRSREESPFVLAWIFKNRSQILSWCKFKLFKEANELSIS